MELIAPMGGTVWKILKQEGDSIVQGEVVMILESMKMEIPIEATMDGIITQVKVNEGDFVQEDDVVVIVKENG